MCYGGENASYGTIGSYFEAGYNDIACFDSYLEACEEISRKLFCVQIFEYSGNILVMNVKRHQKV